MTLRTSREPQHGADSATGTAASAGPGKRTLVDGLGAGEPLPEAPRAQFEKSLGRDLSGVRMHTGDAAAQSAGAVNAHAYASGQDIVFGNSAPRQNDNRWMSLLAHEVAHTQQQQGAAPPGELSTTQPGDAAERNADGAASAMLAGRPATVSAQPASIARKTRDENIDEPARAPEGDAPAGSTASGDAAKADEKSGADEEIGELSASRVGQEVDEGEDVGPDVPVRDTEGGKQEIAAAGQQLPPEGAEDASGGITPEAGAAGAAGGGDAGGDDAAVSPEVTAAVTEAQNDAREAIAQSEADSAAYKAEMAEHRDRFEAEQHATMLEQLKAMTSVEKRQTLQEMGYDPKKVKKLKDAELDALIEGRMESEARKTKILGMTPEELAALSPSQKIQYLVDLGIDRGDLDKAGPDKAARLFDDIMKVAHVPGQHKVKIKIKGGLLGKSWEVTVKCDAEGNTDIQAEKKGGFLSKLWGWVKLALPIILTVLAPLTAGASLIVLGVYQAAMAIKNGDWLGAVLGVVTAIGGVSTFLSIAKGASSAAAMFSKISDVAKKVQKVAEAAQAAMTAAKAKNAGSLLGALAQGASAFASFSGKAAGKFATTMTRWSERLEKWSKVVAGGQKVIQGIKKGDPLAAFGGAFDSVAAGVGAGTGVGKQLTRASKITGFVNAGKGALQSKPPNYAAVADAALGIAAQLNSDRRIGDAAQIISQANRLKQAWDKRESDPGALIDAALGLAQAIQVAKYDVEHDEEKDADGKPLPDAQRAAITTRYQRAGRIVSSASKVLKAAMAKPRPNYIGALDAATQLIAELTDSKQVDAAAVVTTKLDAWTKAVASKDEKAIMLAGIALGEAIDGLRTTIVQERDAAKREAEAQLGPGETLPDDGNEALPAGPTAGDVAAAADDATTTPAPDADGSAPPVTDDTAQVPAGGAGGSTGPAPAAPAAPADLAGKLTALDAQTTSARGQLSYAAIQPLVTAAPQADRDALKTNTWRTFFVRVCDNATMVTALGDLRFDLETKLSWLQAEVISTRFELSYATIRPWITAAPQSERNALKTDAWRTFFVTICDNTTMVTALGDLGFDLATKLTWLNAELTNTQLELSYATIRPWILAAPQAERDALKTDAWREFFLKVCDNTTIETAVTDLRSSLQDRLSWMLLEGTTYAALKRVILAATPGDRATALADQRFLLKLVGELTWDEFAKCAELLGRTAPTGAALMGDPAVIAAYAVAWPASNPAIVGAPPAPAPANLREQGGFIYLNLVTGALTTDRVAAGAQASLPLNNPQPPTNAVTVGGYHTHPNVGPVWGAPFPSGADTNWANRNGIPLLLQGAFPTVAATSMGVTGPARRLHLAGPTGFPGAAGGLAPQATLDGREDGDI